MESTSPEKLPSLAGLLPEESALLLKRLSGCGFPPYRVNQIHRWICSGVSSFEEMKNLPLDLRKSLALQCRIYSSSTKKIIKDKDKTVKLQIKLEDGKRIEAVILRDGKGRKTACLSVQAGCASGCAFCKTAQLGFGRNLAAKEIVEEFLLLQNAAKNEGEAAGDLNRSPITHIVFMGMGEPLLNLDNLRKAVDFFCDEEGLNISKRRITLSTCGIIPGLKDFTEGGPDIRLALSLVSANETLRKRLMPIAVSNPLKELKESLLAYQKKRLRRVTLELVLLKGVNTGTEDAAAAAEFAGGLDAVINLIPWNPVDGIAFETPPPEETALFAEALERRGLKVTRRFEKGLRVSGACGQLGSW